MALTSMEAQSCGRTVVAFGIGGLPDIVEHHATEALAPVDDLAALAAGLVPAIEDARGQDRWGAAARERAPATWSTAAVVASYLKLYCSKRC